LLPSKELILLHETVPRFLAISDRFAEPRVPDYHTPVELPVGNPPLSTMKDIRCLVLDVDGTLTDGRMYYGDDGRSLRAFHVHDGLSIEWFRTYGGVTVVLTGKTSETVAKRSAELGIRRVIQGSRDKLDDFERLRPELGVDWRQVAVMGDDLPDLPLMARAGFSIAPANAAPQVQRAADMVTRASGGHGAVREAIERWLRENGHWPALLARYGAGDTKGD
jgi:3-deoxy-D-manno-octulosonate 8-phosphate phosphatase (KDO 8-P phosphatase)